MLYDVIVVGAGPSGSAAAFTASKLGFHTILIEKEELPRVKTCGGGVSYKALKLIGGVPNSIVEREVHGFQFSGNDFNVVVKSPRLLGVTVMRNKFDYHLTKIAEKNGAEILSKTHIIRVYENSDHIEVISKDGKKIKGKILVGADGFPSTIAVKTGIFERIDPKQAGLAIEWDFSVNKEEIESRIDPNLLYLYYLNLPFGYGWVFPKRDSISIGIGGMMARLKNPITVFSNFKRYIQKKMGIKISGKRYYSHLLPAGGVKRKIYKNRIILVGDAAGLVDPLTGEGIYYAIASGIIAGRTIYNALKNDKLNKAKIAEYPNKIYKAFGADLKISLKLAYNIYPNLRYLFNYMKSEKSTSHTVEALARGEIMYRELLKALLKRTPKIVLRNLGF